ncbi:unnamed protein product [Protopolystoma xenopodis]|uniref:PCI domain-containing protein n=1 Tax=Protopolystoma xenopodis TaxID=117903 RepID=A0A448WXC6_9PLAT|nr:unnamed protein product [Protopolystoma xenopodis]
MSIKPIQFLEGEPVHKLLTIFVNGTLQDLAQFIEKHPDFIKQNDLSEEACLNKLRMLTLMELAEKSSELDYATVAKELKLEEEKLEFFIIEAVRQRIISCKLDQVQRRIIVTGALPRNFGRAQWKNLYETLLNWRTGLTQVQTSLVHMMKASS